MFHIIIWCYFSIKLVLILSLSLYSDGLLYYQIIGWNDQSAKYSACFAEGSLCKDPTKTKGGRGTVGQSSPNSRCANLYRVEYNYAHPVALSNQALDETRKNGRQKGTTRFGFPTQRSDATTGISASGQYDISAK